MHQTKALTLVPLPDFPLVEPGDDLCELILASLSGSDIYPKDQPFADGDILVLAQKIVSKAENRYRYLKDVTPSNRALTLALEVNKDPRLLELILSESESVIRTRPGVIIVEHKNGYVHANAGIDKSNIHCDTGNPRVLLLPQNADASAMALRKTLYETTGVQVSVIINDSAGRAWRNGTVGMAIGTAGFEPIEDLVGEPDLFKREMEVTQVAVADELAAAASFVMGQAAEASPVVVIHGANLKPSNMGSKQLIRAKELDLFR